MTCRMEDGREHLVQVPAVVSAGTQVCFEVACGLSGEEGGPPRQSVHFQVDFKGSLGCDTESLEVVACSVAAVDDLVIETRNGPLSQSDLTKADWVVTQAWLGQVTLQEQELECDNGWIQSATYKQAVGLTADFLNERMTKALQVCLVLWPVAFCLNGIDRPGEWRTKPSVKYCRDATLIMEVEESTSGQIISVPKCFGYLWAEVMLRIAILTAPANHRRSPVTWAVNKHWVFFRVEVVNPGKTRLVPKDTFDRREPPDQVGELELSMAFEEDADLHVWRNGVLAKLNKWVADAGEGVAKSLLGCRACDYTSGWPEMVSNLGGVEGCPLACTVVIHKAMLQVSEPGMEEPWPFVAHMIVDHGDLLEARARLLNSKQAISKVVTVDRMWLTQDHPVMIAAMAHHVCVDSVPRPTKPTDHHLGGALRLPCHTDDGELLMHWICRLGCGRSLPSGKEEADQCVLMENAGRKLWLALCDRGRLASHLHLLRGSEYSTTVLRAPFEKEGGPDAGLWCATSPTHAEETSHKSMLERAAAAKLAAAKWRRLKTWPKTHTIRVPIPYANQVGDELKDNENAVRTAMKGVMKAIDEDRDTETCAGMTDAAAWASVVKHRLEWEEALGGLVTKYENRIGAALWQQLTGVHEALGLDLADARQKAAAALAAEANHVKEMARALSCHATFSAAMEDSLKLGKIARDRYAEGNLTKALSIVKNLAQSLDFSKCDLPNEDTDSYRQWADSRQALAECIEAWTMQKKSRDEADRKARKASKKGAPPASPAASSSSSHSPSSSLPASPKSRLPALPIADAPLPQPVPPHMAPGGPGAPAGTLTSGERRKLAKARQKARKSEAKDEEEERASSRASVERKKAAARWEAERENEERLQRQRADELGDWELRRAMQASLHDHAVDALRRGAAPEPAPALAPAPAGNPGPSRANRAPSEAGTAATGAPNARDECAICMDQPPNSACVPCGCMVACDACLTKQLQTSPNCPWCRTAMTSFLRIMRPS